MPICKNCGSNFPNTKIINDKRVNLSSRKYCLDCSPFGLHNTRPVRLNIDVYNGDHRCLLCGRQYEYNRSKGHTKEICNSCLVNNRIYKLKIKCLEYKGNECSSCGYNANVKALCFHHLDDKEKEFNISGSHCISWERIKAELDKCVLLCSNCHIEEHDRLLK